MGLPGDCGCPAKSARVSRFARQEAQPLMNCDGLVTPKKVTLPVVAPGLQEIGVIDSMDPAI
jgi:hypothetical protein